MWIMIAETQNGHMLWQWEPIYTAEYRLVLDGHQMSWQRQIVPCIPQKAHTLRQVRVLDRVVIDGASHSPEDGEKIVKDMTDKWYPANRDGEREYASLDDEMAHRKFMQTVVREYKNVDVETPVDIICVKIFDPDSKYILCTPYFVDGYGVERMDIDRIRGGRYFSFRPEPVEMFHEVAKEYDLVWDGEIDRPVNDGRIHYSLPNHSGLRFLQVQGKYVGTEMMDVFGHLAADWLTYDEAKKRESDMFDSFRRIIQTEVARHSTIKLDAQTKGHVIDVLRGIASEAQRIEARRSSPATGYTVAKMANNMIAELAGQK